MYARVRVRLNLTGAFIGCKFFEGEKQRFRGRNTDRLGSSVFVIADLNHRRETTWKGRKRIRNDIKTVDTKSLGLIISFLACTRTRRIDT